MSFKELWNWYLTNYRMWKAFQQMPLAIRQIHFWPSETYMKYRPTENFGGRKVLNFGCGRTTYKAPNVVNLDVHPDECVNVVCTTNKLPFENDVFDLVIANHVLEHVPNWFESFKELARVVKPGGVIEVWIPPVSSDSAFTYRDHINRIGTFSFAGIASFNRSGHNLSSIKEFETLGDITRLHLDLKFRRPALYWWTMLAWPSLLTFMSDHLRNVVSEEGFFFRKK